jgi:hypothetical protein
LRRRLVNTRAKSSVVHLPFLLSCTLGGGGTARVADSAGPRITSPLWCRAPNWSIVAHPLGNAGARALRVPKGNAAAPSRRRSSQLPRRFASFASTCFGSPRRPPQIPQPIGRFFPECVRAEMNDAAAAANHFWSCCPCKRKQCDRSRGSRVDLHHRGARICQPVVWAPAAACECWRPSATSSPRCPRGSPRPAPPRRRTAAPPRRRRRTSARRCTRRCATRRRRSPPSSAPRPWRTA